MPAFGVRTSLFPSSSKPWAAGLSSRCGCAGAVELGRRAVIRFSVSPGYPASAARAASCGQAPISVPAVVFVTAVYRTGKTGCPRGPEKRFPLPSSAVSGSPIMCGRKYLRMLWRDRIESIKPKTMICHDPAGMRRVVCPSPRGTSSHAVDRKVAWITYSSFLSSDCNFSPSRYCASDYRHAPVHGGTRHRGNVARAAI